MITFLDEMLIIFVEIFSLGGVTTVSDIVNNSMKEEQRLVSRYSTSFNMKSWLEVTFKDVPLVSQLQTALKCILKFTLFWINIFLWLVLN